MVKSKKEEEERRREKKREREKERKRDVEKKKEKKRNKIEKEKLKKKKEKEKEKKKKNFGLNKPVGTKSLISPAGCCQVIPQEDTELCSTGLVSLRAIFPPQLSCRTHLSLFDLRIFFQPV